MRVSAKADYAVRAMVELAASGGSEEQPAKGEVISAAQAIPPRFLENILGELRVHGLVHSRRGSDGGYWLARDADEITLAEIIRAVEGPLATVRGEGAEEIEYRGAVAAARAGLDRAAGQHPPGARDGHPRRRRRRRAAGAGPRARRAPRGRAGPRASVRHASPERP